MLPYRKNYRVTAGNYPVITELVTFGAKSGNRVTGKVKPRLDSYPMRATCLNKRCQHRAGYLSQFTAGLRSLLFAFNMNSLSLSLEHLLRVYFRSECPPPWSPSFTQSILLRDITSALDDLASNSTVRGAAFQYIQAKCPLLASYQTVSGGTGRHTMRQ